MQPLPSAVRTFAMTEFMTVRAIFVTFRAVIYHRVFVFHVHQLRHPDSVLALAYIESEGHICAGCQDSAIRVWDAGTFQCVKVLKGHTRAVVTLHSPKPAEGSGQHRKRFLFSSSRDNTVRVWSVDDNYACVVVVPLASGNVLHLVALPITSAVAPEASTSASDGSHDRSIRDVKMVVFAGCQNTKVQSTVLSIPSTAPAVETPAMPCHVHWSVHGGHYGFVYAVAVRTLSPLQRPVEAALRPVDSQCGLPRLLIPAATPSCQLLTASGDGSVGVWTVCEDTWELTFHSRLQGHSGSIYALEIVGPDLYSGGQDGTIRVWDLETLHCKQVLTGHKQEVLCFAVPGPRPRGYASSVSTPSRRTAMRESSCLRVLCSGSADGAIRVWSTRTYSCLHVLQGHSKIVVGLCATATQLYSGSTDRTVRVWDLSRLDATSPSDVDISLESPASMTLSVSRIAEPIELSESGLIALLRAFVAIPTVSAVAEHRENCWRGAKFVQELLRSIGAENKLAQIVPGKNPIVIGRLGWEPNVPTITIHGHYDVMPAESSDWASDPFHLTGEDGYLYGRGSSDNKGPVLAAIFAAALARNPHRRFGASLSKSASYSESEPREAACPANFAFIFEGEGENGSEGFQETIKENKDWFAGTTLIMNNNSKWLGDDTPCLTYGLRGRLCFDVEILGPSHDLHSGVDGGVGNEPLMDLMAVVSGLLDPKTGRVLVPGFYDNLRMLSPEETALYTDLDFDAEKYVSLVDIPSVYQPWEAGRDQGVEDGVKLPHVIPVESADARVPAPVKTPRAVHKRARKEPTFVPESVKPSEPVESESTRLLMLRWRMPSLSVHSIRTSSTLSSNGVVIVNDETATVSIRTVPDQDLDDLERKVTETLQNVLSSRGSKNTLRVQTLAKAKWWLQNPFSASYRAAATAIQKHWGVKPNFVCEGGTLRVTPFLEEALEAPAIHIPLAQSTDNAHVANERLRINNLIIGVQVLRSMLCEVGSAPLSE